MVVLVHGTVQMLKTCPMGYPMGIEHWAMGQYKCGRAVPWACCIGPLAIPWASWAVPWASNRGPWDSTNVEEVSHGLDGLAHWPSHGVVVLVHGTVQMVKTYPMGYPMGI